MKTQYFTAASLDGFIADPDDSLEWLFQLDGAEQTGYPAFIEHVGALAMGSTTYEWLLAHVVAEDGDQHAEYGPWPYQQPTWVFSSRELPGVAGADIRFVKGDVRPVHRDMAEVVGDRNVWVVGGGELAGQFLDAGLLDEIHVQVGSVVLGAGKPLLPRRVVSPPMRLVSVHQAGTGFAELVYEIVRPEGGAAT